MAKNIIFSKWNFFSNYYNENLLRYVAATISSVKEFQTFTIQLLKKLHG